ncbi:hypothetical protein LTR05_006917 [Lithohypha guttulata]|uniref:Uncharacterized protein n=1 Tax=Lithohypha guttulata TaxID=1690604 RepID=A0AAN7YED2_9EURO|nr:hypothetical protein LTR05_006917 [Lithohypha guttulata]
MPSHSHPRGYPLDEPDYGRDREPARGTRRERDGRDVREREREVAREPRRPMDPETARLPARVIETDIMGGDRQRVANTGIVRPPPQQESRTGRNIMNLRDRDDEMIYDTRPSQYPTLRDQADREPARRTPYDGEFDDIPAAVRPVIDPSGGRSRVDSRPKYNEYFLPGDGIDREVIQSELCRYLGQDATMKPGEHHDGRKGYIIRAYRALTTEMIRSLKEDSVKYARERETAIRRNRQPAPFQQFRDQDRYGADDEMMVDAPEESYSRTRYEEPRMRAPPVTSGYMAEAGYPAYYPVSTTQPPPPGVDPRMDPRYIPGNTTPPTGRAPGYSTQGYAPITTRTSIPAIPAGGAAYADPRTGVVRDPGYGAYQSETRGNRHR